MPVVCDFVVVQGDVDRRIGDKATLWEKKFSTGGRHAGGAAILMLMVKGLTATKSDVDVKINNKSVGRIFDYYGADPNHWFTQIINVGANVIKDGENELQMQAVTWPGASQSNLFDDFYVRDVICVFQQST